MSSYGIADAIATVKAAREDLFAVIARQKSMRRIADVEIIELEAARSAESAAWGDLETVYRQSFPDRTPRTD